MTLINLAKAPFPYFGGKSKAADLVWSLLGDVPHYVEPFAGSLAVLLNRPHPANRPHFSETVNDADGLIVNVWRSIAAAPDEVASHASWPVMEADKTARQMAVLRWRTDAMLDRLAGDPEFHDARMAGWWLWGMCAQIGAIGGNGPWTVDPVTGRIFKQPRGPVRQPGVSRDLPHVGGDGQGVNRPAAREPGVSDVRWLDDGNPDGFHPVTMPELQRWMRYLAARLRHVRVLNGDWSRLVTTGAAHTLSVRQGHGPAGVFLDPPYASSERAGGLYTGGHDNGDVAQIVNDWCARLDPTDPKWRVVLAGYDTEHSNLEHLGWTVHEWFTAGHLTGGMGNISKTGGHQQKRERLWASPQCVITPPPEPDPQLW